MFKGERKRETKTREEGGKETKHVFFPSRAPFFLRGRGIPYNVLLGNVPLENFFRLQAKVGIYHSMVSFFVSRYVKRVQVAGHWGWASPQKTLLSSPPTRLSSPFHAQAVFLGSRTFEILRTSMGLSYLQTRVVHSLHTQNRRCNQIIC